MLFKNVPETINIDVGLSLILTLYEPRCKADL